MSNRELTHKQQENKKEDKKALKVFIWLIPLGFALGILVGIGSSYIREVWNVEWMKGIEKAGSIIGVHGGYVVITILMVAAVLLYRKSRKEYAGWDGEDEEVYNRIETRLSYVSWFAHLIVIFSYFFMATGAYVNLGDKGRMHALMDTSFSGWMFSVLLVLGTMIYGVVASLLLQQKTINLEKEMNPEKCGSIYDMHFNKKWMESCDEAEKFITYKSSYMAMRAGNYTCIGLWLVCLVGMLMFDMGILPLCMVLVVWLVQTTTYSLRVIYFAKHPSEVMK